MSKLLPSPSCSRGFTLLELTIAIAIFGIASAAIYATYQHQQDSYLIQEQVADMQQNLRAGIYFLTRGIKMAGYDPTEKAGAAAHRADDSVSRDAARNRAGIVQAELLRARQVGKKLDALRPRDAADGE